MRGKSITMSAINIITIILLISFVLQAAIMLASECFKLCMLIQLTLIYVAFFIAYRTSIC